MSMNPNIYSHDPAEFTAADEKLAHRFDGDGYCRNHRSFLCGPPPFNPPWLVDIDALNKIFRAVHFYLLNPTIPGYSELKAAVDAVWEQSPGMRKAGGGR